MLDTLHLCLVSAIIFYGVTGIENGPRNAAVKKSGIVSFVCQNDITTMSGLVWSFRPVGRSNFIMLYRDSNILQKAARISVAHEYQKRQMHLIIREAMAGDAGSYRCLTASGDYSAHLVIIDSDPICEVLLENKKVNYSGWHGDVDEHDTVTMFCKMGFWGSWIPTIEWQINGEYPRDNQTKVHQDNDSVTSTFTLLIAPATFRRNLIQISCTTIFSTFNKPRNNIESTEAMNCPDYTHTWQAPILRIKSSSDPSSEHTTKTKRDQHVNQYYNNQIVSYVSCFSAGIVVTMIAVVVLKKFKPKKTSKRELNPEQIHASQKSDYSEINETKMKVELVVVESRGKRLEINDETTNKLVQTTASEAERSSNEEDASFENREYDNINHGNRRRGNEGITVYENEEQRDFGLKESQTDGSTTSPSKQRKIKNYTVLDPSTRASSAPPSVYRRLKSKPFKPNPTKQPVTCVKAEKFPFDCVDVEYCSIESLRPKLPTPESSSLSESSN